MKDPDLSEQHDCNPAASPVADLRPKLHKQGLDVSPRQIAAGGAGENQLKGALVPALHAINSTTRRYHAQGRQLPLCNTANVGLTGAARLYPQHQC